MVPPRAPSFDNVLFLICGVAYRPDKPGFGHEQLLEIHRPKHTSSSCLPPG